VGEAAHRRLSYAEYLELEERSDVKHEYVDGVVFAMSGGRSSIHGSARRSHTS